MTERETISSAKTAAAANAGGPRKRVALKLADVEYRVEFNEAAQVWDVTRNGVATAVTARKKRSYAVDSAIRDAKAEHGASAGRIMVTCRQGRVLQTVWKSA